MNLARLILLFALLVAGPELCREVRADESGTLSGEIAYTADLLRNLKGGLNRGSTSLHNLDLILSINTPSLGVSGSGLLFTHILWNDANTFSDRFPGDLQVVSNIDTSRAMRVFELWYEQNLTDSMSLRFGLYDLNSEFDAIETAGLFLNSSHGIGFDYSQTGRNAPSIFPVTSLSARLQWQVGKRSLLRYALLDAVPGDPDDPSATRIRLGGDDGALHALEFNHETAGGTRIGLGGFAYSGEFDRIVQGSPGAPVQTDDSTGFYAFVDTPLFSSGSRALSAFLRLGVANEAVNVAKGYLGAGLVFAGILPDRPHDSLGLAVASARMGSDFKRASDAGSHETTIELTYSMRISDWLVLQPDIQYVFNPGADPLLENALVVGLRLVAFRRLGSA